MSLLRQSAARRFSRSRFSRHHPMHSLPRRRSPRRKNTFRCACSPADIADCVQVDEVQSHTALFDHGLRLFLFILSLLAGACGAFCRRSVSRLGLDTQSLVVEVASNDGYLLNTSPHKASLASGSNRTSSTARARRDKGVETIERFFGRAFAEEFVATRGKARSDRRK